MYDTRLTCSYMMGDFIDASKKLTYIDCVLLTRYNNAIRKKSSEITSRCRRSVVVSLVHHEYVATN